MQPHPADVQDLLERVMQHAPLVHTQRNRELHVDPTCSAADSPDAVRYTSEPLQSQVVPAWPSMCLTCTESPLTISLGAALDCLAFIATLDLIRSTATAQDLRLADHQLALIGADLDAEVEFFTGCADPHQIGLSERAAHLQWLLEQVRDDPSAPMTHAVATAGHLDAALDVQLALSRTLSRPSGEDGALFLTASSIAERAASDPATPMVVDVSDLDALQLDLLGTTWQPGADLHACLEAVRAATL